ncbi:unnamed protein product [Paramecium sonneborni]|uniref:Uncharacterized protein n=1 Tax=Paramecium sonneborni TaxID=65129 RepID=A0A8S1LX30_9CILI|nr:unnamed protein product [Paramecium sonneborni]
MQNSRKGKPKNCQYMDTDEIIWMKNQKCLELDNLLNQGTYNFSYIPRQGEMNQQDRNKQAQLMKSLQRFGWQISSSSSIVLFKKKLVDLMKERSNELYDRYLKIISDNNVEELQDIYEQMDEEFVKELLQIWENMHRENELAQTWLYNIQPENCSLVVKNAYLNSVKKRNAHLSIQTFEQYVASQDAQEYVINIIRQFQNVLRQ